MKLFQTRAGAMLIYDRDGIERSFWAIRDIYIFPRHFAGIVNELNNRNLGA